MNSDLHRSILKTLAYFDTFDFPLTAEEIYRWLWAYDGSATPSDMRKALHTLQEQGKIHHHASVYYLPQRRDIVSKRQQAVPLVKQKLEIARKAGRYLRYIPFIRAMYVCNTVAGAVPHEESDIDVFIIVRPGRLWFTRALVTLLFSMLRLRRTKTRVHNRICLSFYVTSHHINLSDIAWGTPDIYLAYWLDQLIPIYDQEHVLQEIYRENAWVKKWLPHALVPTMPHPRFSADKAVVPHSMHWTGEYVFGGLIGETAEKIARSWQCKKMSRNVESLQKLSDSRVVVNDTMLKFHENDRRDYFRQRWKNRCFELNI